jgi:hypothetical protein
MCEQTHCVTSRFLALRRVYTKSNCAVCYNHKYNKHNLWFLLSECDE